MKKLGLILLALTVFTSAFANHRSSRLRAVWDFKVTKEDHAVTIAVLKNDNRFNKGVITLISATNGGKGSTVINADSTITYTPNLNQNGWDKFSYTITNAAGKIATAKVYIIIRRVNDIPVLGDDEFTIAKNETIVLDVLANDTDADGDKLIILKIKDLSSGKAKIRNRRTKIKFTPEADFAGDVTFTYTVTDRRGAKVSANVVIHVSDDDQFEDNDTMETATDLIPVFNGSTSIALQNLNLKSNDDDWYKITLTETSSLDIILLFSPGYGEFDIDTYLFDESGSLVTFSETSNDNETIFAKSLPAGCYFLQVTGYEGSSNHYDMNIDIIDMNSDDALEENDTLATAKDITPNIVADNGHLNIRNLIVLNGDDDLYKVSLPSDGSLFTKINFSSETADLDLDLQVLDASGAIVGSSNASNSSESVLLNGLTAGDYYIKIDCAAGSTNLYHLTVFSEPHAIDDTYEENDTKAGATDLDAMLVGNSVSLENLEMISFDEDWFKLTVGEGSTLNVEALFTPGNGTFDLDVEIVNENGDIIGTGYSGGPNENITVENLPAGTYYIRIYGWQNAHNNYQLNVSIQ